MNTQLGVALGRGPKLRLTMKSVGVATFFLVAGGIFLWLQNDPLLPWYKNGQSPITLQTKPTSLDLTIGNTPLNIRADGKLWLEIGTAANSIGVGTFPEDQYPSELRSARTKLGISGKQVPVVSATFDVYSDCHRVNANFRWCKFTNVGDTPSIHIYSLKLRAASADYGLNNSLQTPTGVGGTEEDNLSNHRQLDIQSPSVGVSCLSIRYSRSCSLNLLVDGGVFAEITHDERYQNEQELLEFRNLADEIVRYYVRKQSE